MLSAFLGRSRRSKEREQDQADKLEAARQLLDSEVQRRYEAEEALQKHVQEQVAIAAKLKELHTARNEQEVLTARQWAESHAQEQAVQEARWEAQATARQESEGYLRQKATTAQKVAEEQKALVVSLENLLLQKEKEKENDAARTEYFWRRWQEEERERSAIFGWLRESARRYFGLVLRPVPVSLMLVLGAVSLMRWSHLPPPPPSPPAPASPPSPPWHPPHPPKPPPLAPGAAEQHLVTFRVALEQSQIASFDALAYISRLVL